MRSTGRTSFVSSTAGAIFKKGVLIENTNKMARVINETDPQLLTISLRLA